MKKTSLSLTLISILLLFNGDIIADNPQDQSFDDIDRMLDQQFKQKTSEIDSLYNAYSDAIDDAFNGITKKIEVKWPKNVKLPTKKVWVGYSKNLQTRSIVDYEVGEVIIETMVTNNDLNQAKHELEAMAEKLTSPTITSIDKLDVITQAVNENLRKKGINIPSKELKNKNILKSILPKKIKLPESELLKSATVSINGLSTVKEAISLSSTILTKEILPIIPVIELQANSSTQKISTPPVEIVAKAKEPIIPAESQLQNIAVESIEQLTLVEETSTLNSQITTKEILPIVSPITLENDSLSQTASDIPAEIAIETKEPIIKLDLVESAEGSLLKMTIKFVNNYQKVLLANNFDEVKTFSKKYDVAISVILAIIETESSYNPRAISRVPAFGLMQLVPKTAGIDAYNYVHGQKKILSPDYLFDETNNLQLGTAYFKLLKSRYLRKIDDPQSRFYCAVSSYNTGVGNLAKTFTGQKNLSKAAEIINKMTADEVYQYLLINLPAEETRNYLKKIVNRRAKYIHFDNEIKEI